MPRFAFGKRRSTAEGDNEVPPPSFRVLDRSEVIDAAGKTFDNGARLSTKQQGLPRSAVADLSYEDDLFSDFKPNTTNRYVVPGFHSSGFIRLPGRPGRSPISLPLWKAPNLVTLVTHVSCFDHRRPQKYGA